MNRTLLFWSLWLTGTMSFAQGSEIGSVDDMINAIKRDTAYIYAESTMRDPVEAMSNARAILEIKVSDWLRRFFSEDSVNACLTSSREKWAETRSHRGNYTRVIAFVRKDLVAPSLAWIWTDEPQEKVAVNMDPEVIMPSDEVFVLEGEMVPEAELTPEEGKMVKINTFDFIEPYIKGLLNEERVLAYGKYATLPHQESCYIFIYTREGKVDAVLHQQEDGSQFNLRTMQNDQVRNYKNCGAIWFQLNND